MNKDEINLAFEGRWRLKGNYGKFYQNTATMSFDEFFEYCKGLCKDFFEAGIILGQGYEVIVTNPADFEVWWNLYQKKRGKEKCQKKWAKLSQKDRQACIAATPAYVESTPDVTYRKDPYTYLNNKSWEDEIYFRQTREQQQQQRLAESANLVAKYTGADKGTKG